MFLQKVVIKSNSEILKIKWTENEYESIELKSDNNIFILYRKFDNIRYDNIKIYYEIPEKKDIFNFQMRDKYKHKIIIMIKLEENGECNMYIDDKINKRI